MPIFTLTKPGGGSDTLENLNVELCKVVYALNGQGYVELRLAGNYDSNTISYGEGQIVSLMVDGVVQFTGRVAQGGISAGNGAEGSKWRIEETWKDLSIIYQENWTVGQDRTQTLLPLVVLGMDESGRVISTGTQAQKAIDYAVAHGAYFQAGGTPEGVTLWPSEGKNLTCEQVLTQAMEENLDWFGMMIHGGNGPSSKPALMVLSYSGMATQTILFSSGINPPLDTNVVTAFDVGYENRKIPNGCQITYLTTSIGTDANGNPVTVRDVHLDQAGICDGLKVISSVIELAGNKAQCQKVAIQTRPIPQAVTGGAGAVKTFLAAHFPILDSEDVDLSEWDFDHSTYKVAYDDDSDEAQPPAINPEALRLDVRAASELPRELVRGSIADWMRVKVGKVRITCRIYPTADADDRARKALQSVTGLRHFSVTGTNATTKIYHGPSQWTAGDKIPTDLAAAIFAKASATHATGYVERTFEGWISNFFCGFKIRLVEQVYDAIGNVTPHLLLDGGTVHQHEIDIETGIERIEFGAPPDYSANDWIEIQRRLARRIYTGWSMDERQSERYGSASTPSSKGDTVGGYDHPSFAPAFAQSDGEVAAFRPSVSVSDGKPMVAVEPGVILCVSSNSKVALTEDVFGPAGMAEVGESDLLWIFIEIDASGNPLNANWESTTGADEVWSGTTVASWQDSNVYLQKKAFFYLGRVEADSNGGYRIADCYEGGNLFLTREVTAGKLAQVLHA